MAFQADREYADKLREEGNTWFKKQQFGLAKKNYADAIELLDMCALSTVDDDAVKAACLLNLAALMKHRNGKSTCTESALALLLGVDRGDTEGFGCTAAQLKLEEWRECEESCTAALRLDEQSLKAFLRRARALMQLGDKSRASADISAALALDPNCKDALEMRLQLEKNAVRQAQRSTTQQKKAFGSFWGGGGGEGAGEKSGGREKSKGGGLLYDQEVKEVGERKRKQICYLEISQGAKVLGKGRDLAVTLLRLIIVELHPDKVPKTAHNFLSLCQGVKEGGGGRRADGVELSYKGTELHRVCKGFVVQGGDIVYREGEDVGEGLASVYGGAFKDENLERCGHHYHEGVLGMASAGPDTNGSQFYITLGAAPWLDRISVICGHVVAGMKALREVEGVEVDAEDRPLERVWISDCGELSEAEVAAAREEERAGGKGG